MLQVGLLAGALAGCSGDDLLSIPEVPTSRDAGSEDSGEPGDFPSTGVGSGELEVLRVEPGSGPFGGGNEVVLRGSGFTPQTRVSIGGRSVAPGDSELEDPHRLRVKVPAGEVGPADVRVEQQDASAVLTDGYVYSAIQVQPSVGSVAGGTLVEIIGKGTQFEEAARAQFDGLECAGIERLSATRLRCRAPAHEAGAVDVRVEGPSGPSWVAERAFVYEESENVDSGGLSGGAIDGTVNLTVIDTFTGLRLPDAFAMLGNDLGTAHQGRTDGRGRIVFSDPELQGPQTVHVAKDCYENGSIVGFDATSVTVFLRRLTIQRCIPPIDPQFGTGARGTGIALSFVSGELVWPGGVEFGPGPWDNIPEPREGEQRVAYVFTTRSSAASSNPPPDGSSDTVHRLVEETAEQGVHGYPYRILVRPAAFAVYAIAGLEDTESGELIPYVMGVARDVIAAPSEEVEGVDIPMDIPLDRSLDVQLSSLPERARRGPDVFVMQAHLNLGGEGVLVREVGDRRLDRVYERSSGRLLQLWAQPLLTGALSDARYDIRVGWYTGSFGGEPYTQTMLQSVQSHGEPVEVDDLLGVPRAVAPPAGASLPDDRILRWSADGSEASLHQVTITQGTTPAWRIVAPGERRSVPIPDLSSVEGLSDLAGNALEWRVLAMKIPAFRFQGFSYDVLSSRYWTHDAVNSFPARR